MVSVSKSSYLSVISFVSDNYEKLPDIVKETFDIKESFKSLIKK